MKNSPNLVELNTKIRQVKQLLTELEADADLFPALSKNSKRALASLKMLELNISDIVTFDLADT